MNEEPKKQWRRFEKIRSGKHVRRKLRKIETASVRHAHKFIIKRWENIRDVRRHALSWLLLVGTMIVSLLLQTSFTKTAFQTESSAIGGTYSEAVLGRLDNLNPIYASTQPERAASKLLFASLLSYDTDGALNGDLAVAWNVLDQGKRYQVTLRDNLQWDDGQPITADDVVYTIDTIKDANASAPRYLYESWRGITVTKVDNQNVQFDLPAAYAPFPHLLTIGILPAHKLDGIEPTELRNASFNRQPVASGPFSFRSLQNVNVESGRSVVHMVGNSTYYSGKPKLERFQLHIYGDRDEMRRAFIGGEVTAVADFTAQDLEQIDNLEEFKVRDLPLNNVALAILRTDSPFLQDVNVRAAIRSATDTNELISQALNGRASELVAPLPSSLITGQTSAQPGFDLQDANQKLDAAGWVRGEDGKRSKNGELLRLNVATISTGDYPKVLETLVSQWSELGITINTILTDSADVQQNIIAPRAYDVLIYELAIGGDPDVYAYWHSSQANMRGLNLANYKSGKADDALSSSRSRFEMDLRDAKYKTFVDQWIVDVPAIALYQPSLHYVSRSDISIQGTSSLVDSIDRYRDIQYWSTNVTSKNQTP